MNRLYVILIHSDMVEGRIASIINLLKSKVRFVQFPACGELHWCRQFITFLGGKLSMANKNVKRISMIGKQMGIFVQ